MTSAEINETVIDKALLTAADFKNRDIVTINDIADRLGCCYTTASTILKGWKRRLKAENRDGLDVAGKITKVDYAYILGIDIKLLY